MVRVLLQICAAVSLGATALVGWAFHERYWRWRDCFNELGRCYVPEHETVYTEGGFVWGVLAATMLALTVAFMAASRAQRR